MSDQILWFASRGSGVVSLLLSTAVVCLGLGRAITPGDAVASQDVSAPRNLRPREGDRLVFAVVVDEATASQRRTEPRVVNGNDRLERARGIALEVNLAVVVVGEGFEQGHLSFLRSQAGPEPTQNHLALLPKSWMDQITIRK